MYVCESICEYFEIFGCKRYILKCSKQFKQDGQKLDQVNELCGSGWEDRLTGWSGMYWSKVHFNNRFWTQRPAWETDYDALQRQFVEVVLKRLVPTADIFISEDCLMRGSRYMLILSIFSRCSPCASHINREIGQVINRTVDLVYLFPFPVTADSEILVRFRVARQLKEHADGWDT